MQDFPLIAMIAAGFTAAWILGLLTQWLRLSPIVGYLLAGVLIGPYTPGFQADIHLAHQLAEVGVILLMFGVGLHFHLADLLAVKSVAIPGALGQSLAATLVSIGVFQLFNMEPMTGAVIGMALAVASTVVLMRVLLDADVLNSPAGHVAVGWLLVEDVLTVIVLVMIPILGNGGSPAGSSGIWSNPWAAIALAVLKLVVLVGIVIVIGSRLVPWVLMKVARLRSRELFTLTVMVFSIAIATGAYIVFGASMALGAFLAGMMVAQSPVSHQAAADALPMRDAFAVLFFVSVGMLFDPLFLVREPLMMLAVMGVILLVKPLVALIIVAVLGHSVRTALTVALGLAQIGEFSFILSDLAWKAGLMPAEGQQVLVGGAILSITLNPLLFRSLNPIENWLRKHPRLWELLNARIERRVHQGNIESAERITHEHGGLAIVIGFGPAGRTVDRLLRNAGLTTIIIDMNMETVLEVKQQGRIAIFGDASREAILKSAGVERASHLLLTVPEAANRELIVSQSRHLNPLLKIVVRARYLREREILDQVGATAVIYEEAEAAVALARFVLVDSGAGHELIESTMRDIRRRLIVENVSALPMLLVRNIMVPWLKVRYLFKSSGLDEVQQQVREQHFSRWPVIEVRSRHPSGYLLAKDLVGLNADGPHWTSMIRPISAVSPDDDIESTLQHFQEEGTTVSLVNDSCGKPVGLVTIEDILEQVIGQIEDEYPRQTKVLLRDHVLTESALLDLASQNPEQAIVEMAAKIPAERLPLEANIVERTLARERQLSTSVGFGVAIPHARCPKLASPLVIFGRSLEGIVFDRGTSERVHLIFLLITPSDQPNLQVHLLSQIAAVAGDPEKRKALLALTSESEVRRILTDDGD